MAVSSTLIQWKRSEEGFTESKCGRFEIEPIFIGRTTPQAFQLYYRETAFVPRKKIRGFCDTQREAKNYAQSFLVWEK